MLNYLGGDLVLFYYLRMYIDSVQAEFVKQQAGFPQCLLKRFLTVFPESSVSCSELCLLESVPVFPCASHSETQSTPPMNLVHCHLSS